MEPISIFLTVTFVALTSFIFGFSFGYNSGKQELHFQILKNLISNFKKNTFQKLLPKQKIAILNSKDELPEEETQEEN